MKGRKPIPTELKRAMGNPGKRKLNENEPKPEVEAPDMPAYLTGYARKEWAYIAPALEKLGIIGRIDRMALACYCEACGSYVEALTELEKKGAVIEGADGGEVKSKWRIIADNQRQAIKQFLVEFGLTPSSRTRLVTKQPGAVDELAEFIKEE